MSYQDYCAVLPQNLAREFFSWKTVARHALTLDQFNTYEALDTASNRSQGTILDLTNRREAIDLRALGIAKDPSLAVTAYGIFRGSDSFVVGSYESNSAIGGGTGGYFFQHRRADGTTVNCEDFILAARLFSRVSEEMAPDKRLRRILGL